MPKHSKKPSVGVEVRASGGPNDDDDYNQNITLINNNCRMCIC